MKLSPFRLALCAALLLQPGTCGGGEPAQPPSDEPEPARDPAAITDGEHPPNEPDAVAPADNPAMANPAAQNCVQKGGQVERRTSDSGGQYSVCKFDDGSYCEAFAFMRGQCSKGACMDASGQCES